MSKYRDIASLISSSSKVAKPKSNKSSKPLPSSDEIIKNSVKVNSTESIFNAWNIKGSHLVYKVPPSIPILKNPVKIASFDLDGTIIRTSSGRKFAVGPWDWKWNSDSTLSKLKSLQGDDFLIVIFSNQGGVVARRQAKSLINFVTKLNKMLDEVNDDLFIFASTKRPKGGPLPISSEKDHSDHRKPSLGMWQEFLNLLKSMNEEMEIDMEQSFFCGDAAGRPTDFSDSDKIFAEKVGLKFFTPEELFQ